MKVKIIVFIIITLFISSCSHEILDDVDQVYYLGTINNPIIIHSLPFTDLNNTKTDGYSNLDSYNGLSTDYSGNEIIYRIKIESITSLNIGIATDIGVDVDAIVLNINNINTITARISSYGNIVLDNGDYYIIVDSCKISGAIMDGHYEITISN